MRNPVGPLPSSIYWRRRAVALCLLALAAVVVLWWLNSGGGGGGSGDGKGSGAPGDSHTPVATITAGPAPSGTHISGRPGGRDTAPGDGGSNGGSGDGGGSAAPSASGDAGSTAGSTAGSGSGSTPGDTAGATGGGGSDQGAAGGSPDGGSGTGGEVPADPALPDCAPGSVRLSLVGAQNSYAPGEAPTFRLRAANSGGVTCKMDFGPAQAVFTITKATDSSHVWASNDCPSRGSYLLQVPAHGTATYTLRWNAETSSPKCAKPKGQAAAPGTYLVQAAVPGYGSKQVSFVLSAD
ncbi:hypothetical protein [Actinacidiphila sp. ITFR-21]|uniref:hypothetical protein n=1 Tax=Actinacidiphila sp. ITFR-21 TaxID=3075199 RepID=UPI00288B8918|nr:hypothetical protein [Streptomyces sp. ITFR-21]WNI19724.1 hypothetical protein RLT57_17335 [Streptomyces sp. ITFR-21]